MHFVQNYFTNTTKTSSFTWAYPEGGGRGSGPPPLKNHKNIGFHSNTGPSQHSMLGHHRHASEMPFKWRFAGGAHILWYLDPLSSHKLKKQQQKRRCHKIGPSLAQLSGSEMLHVNFAEHLFFSVILNWKYVVSYNI